MSKEAAAKTADTAPLETPKAAAVYTKDQFLASAKFIRQDRDILAALLDKNKTYTIAEAQAVIKQFKAKEAK